MYSLRKVKTWNTPDGEGYSAELMDDGTPVGRIHNDGRGGETEFYWGSRAAADRFSAFVATQPAIQVNGVTIEASPDRYATELVDAVLMGRKFKRLSKTRTLFRLAGDDPERWRCLMAPLSSRTRRQLTDKYGDRVVIWEP